MIRAYGQQVFNVGMTALTMVLSSQVVRAKMARDRIEAENDALRADLDALRRRTTSVDCLGPVATDLKIDAGALATALREHVLEEHHPKAAAAPRMV